MIQQKKWVPTKNIPIHQKKSLLITKHLFMHDEQNKVHRTIFILWLTFSDVSWNNYKINQL